LTGCLALAAGAASAADAGIEGFTQPFLEIDVASVETGILVTVDVEEGEQVLRDQPLARLDKDVIEASLRIADKQQQLHGQLDSAQAELRLREDRLHKLRKLLNNNHASQEEVDRAAAEQEIAQARVLAAEEALQVKKLEFDRIQAQLDRRTIRSPVDGVIKKVHKEIGEFVAPTDPVVLTVVKLDPLLATFAVPAEQAGQLSLGQTARIRMDSGKATLNGTVKFVSPVVDAQSSTVTVKVELPNPQGAHRSGERCVLMLTDSPVKLTRTSRNAR
jgi:RND family efflux transporter MFP subunit